jgi:hypothetical protein
MKKGNNVRESEKPARKMGADTHKGSEKAWN